MEKSAKQHADPDSLNHFEFMLVEAPSHSKDQEYKRRVRSHVTRQQHRRTRIAARKAKPRPDDESTSPRTVTESYVDICHEALERDGPNVISLSRSASPLSESSIMPSSGTARAFSSGVFALRVFGLHDRDNVFGRCLNKLKVDVLTAIDCYGTFIRSRGQDYAVQHHVSKGNARDTLGSTFFSGLANEPVLMMTGILFIIQYRHHKEDLTFTAQEQYNIILMERHLVMTLNEALSDLKRSIAWPMFCAVIACASYESLFGTPIAFHAHMRGLVEMVRLRGGLDAIMAESPKLAKTLIWTDMNTCAAMHCKPYLQRPSIGLQSPEKHSPNNACLT